MSIEEIRKNAPDGATHYYYITSLTIEYAKKYKFLFIFTEYALWGGELGWVEYPWGFDINRLKPLH